jgi:hypothetical protein
MLPVPKLILSVLVLISSVVLVSSYDAQTQSHVGTKHGDDASFQGLERAIRKSKDFDPPVSIEAVKTKGRSVPLNKKFIDEDDWLKGFTVLVRNNSNKIVTHVGVKLLFRPIGGGVPAAWMLYYGPDPFSDKTADAVAKSSVSGLSSGEELELKLSDVELEDLTAFLKKVGFPKKVHVVDIRINTLGFSDGTAWYGKMLKRGSGKLKWTGADASGGPLNHHPLRGRAHANLDKFFFLQTTSSFASQRFTTTLLQPLKPQTGCGDWWPMTEECSWENQPENCHAPRAYPTGEGLNWGLLLEIRGDLHARQR